MKTETLDKDSTLFPVHERAHVQLLWKTDERVELLLVARLSAEDNQRLS